MEFMEFSVDFKSIFASDYETTKKRSSNETTSVRCFPTCCEVGHVTQGFCGSPIFATIFRTNLEGCTTQYPGFQMQQALIVGEIQPLRTADTSSIQDYCSENEVRMNAMGQNAKYVLGKVTSLQENGIFCQYEVVFELRPWILSVPTRSPTNSKGEEYAFVISILWPDSYSLAHLRLLARMMSSTFTVCKQRKSTGMPPLAPSRSCEPPLLTLKRPRERDEPESSFERRRSRSNSFSSRSSSEDDWSLPSSPMVRSLSRADSFEDNLTTHSTCSCSTIDGLEMDYLGFDLGDDDFGIDVDVDRNDGAGLNDDTELSDDDADLKVDALDGDFLQGLLDFDNNNTTLEE
jgi:hypothetical protein